MNENIANVLKKINEMQMKLNIINDNIEEIKNDRKNLEKNKKANNIYMKNNSSKNFFKNNISSNYANFIYQKNLNNSSKFINFNMNKSHMQNKNRKNENANKFNMVQAFNKNATQDDDNRSPKSYIINYLDKKSSYIKKNRTCISTININDKNNFDMQKKTNQSNDYFYNKKSINNKNNCYFPKKVLNSTNYEGNDIKVYDNNIRRSKDINLLRTTKKQIRIKKLLNENMKKNSKNPYNIINTKKRVFNGTKSKNSLNNDNYYEDSKKDNELNEDNSKSNKDIFFNNNILENIKAKYSISKNKTRNNTYHKLKCFNNNKDEEDEKVIQFQKNKNSINNNISEDTNIKNKRHFSIDNQKFKNQKISMDDIKFPQSISPTKCETSKKNPKIDHKINNFFKNYSDYNNRIKKDANYEQILLDIIDITNEYNNIDNKKININNVIDEYKLLLKNIKIKNEFIYKLINMYNKSTKSNLNCMDPKSLLSIWNWIIINQNKKNNSNSSSKNEDAQYKHLCQEIMKQYNLKNIKQLKMFINKSFKKIDNNDNFLEGIKKILLE